MKKNSFEKTLLNVIGDWVSENKKVFWKYEVSSYYKQYSLSVTNLPDPSIENITVVSNNRLLNNDQKIKLCNRLKKACAQAGELSNTCIKVQIQYENEKVVTAAV
jgi:hypothetical protein